MNQDELKKMLLYNRLLSWYRIIYRVLYRFNYMIKNVNYLDNERYADYVKKLIHG